MKLGAIDIGNTAIKCVVWDGPVSGLSCQPVTFASVEEAAGLLEREKVEAVAFSTTRHLGAEERETISRKGWWEFGPDCRLPIGIRYKTPETLGRDRLAAAVGAWGLFPGESLLIADVGTALTLDVVQSDGDYLGGNISLGIDIRFEALHTFTSRLPRVELAGEPGLLGYDTATAIRRGALWGVANEIAGTFVLAAKEYGCRRVVLTGGGAPVIRENVATVLGCGNIDFVPALVQVGLKLAYELNHDK